MLTITVIVMVTVTVIVIDVVTVIVTVTDVVTVTDLSFGIQRARFACSVGVLHSDTLRIFCFWFTSM